MKKIARLIIALLVLASASACNLPSVGPGGGEDLVSTQVARTLAALTLQAGPPSSDSASPSDTPGQTQTSTPEVTEAPQPGAITGSVTVYPYGSLPSLAIVAIGQGTGNYTYVINAAGDTYFFLESQYLMPGQYWVVAYDPSGHAGGCPTLLTVESGQTASCNVTDWTGSYPSRPGGVPAP